ncbi:S41 family peptidase [Niabella beijingensis]|uniref:S41 family peptidase n=1 Tax=Niabella beijingensis TaxID=2872700 RepID=UPI001CBED715|nr:S41 family peptidase [Niabella beijingensis]MBZ4188501.1 hypothetical protein [Niabella beijingensis]
MRPLLLLFLLKITLTGCAQKTTPEVRNAAAFAKLFGYVRYFHPSDEAASIDWNKFAVYGANAVSAATSDEELIIVLHRLFDPIAPSVQIGKAPKFELKSITPANPIDYKPVFWFHTGVGLSDNSIYSSLRLNRPRPIQKNSKREFAPFSQGIDATPLRNKEIRLVGRMKANVSENSGGHFWLRVDKSEGTGFFYNMADRPVTQTNWNSYEFTGRVDRDANEIYFGGFLQGKGIIWVEEIALFQRDKDSDPWIPVSIKNGDFNTLEDSLPSGWSAGPVNGYKFAVSHPDTKNILQISSEDPASTEGPVVSTIDYQQPPAAGTFVQKQIHPDIKAIIPISLYGTPATTYPAADTTALAILKEDISRFARQHKTADDLSVRLGAVVIAWNIFKHFFPYWNDASKDPDAILNQALNKCFTDTTPLEFKNTLLKMTEPLNDGHIWVSLDGDTTEAYFLPLQLALAENRIVVDAVLDSALTTVRKGDLLEKIDGQAVMDLYKERMGTVSGSPQWKSYRAISGLINGKAAPAVTITLQRDGKQMEQTLSRSMSRYQYYAITNQASRKSGKIAQGIYYLNLNTLPKDSIDQWAGALAASKGIICDLRGYPNSNHNLINYLLKEEEHTKWMFVPKTAYPDQEKTEFMGEGWNMKPQNPRFKGKVVFITDGRAISYAESFMGFIKDFKLATIVGQPTAGTNGNINPFSLPGGYTVSWTGMLVKNHDGSRHHLKGILPDVPMERTIKGIRGGKDEFLDKALEIVSK